MVAARLSHYSSCPLYLSFAFFPLSPANERIRSQCPAPSGRAVCSEGSPASQAPCDVPDLSIAWDSVAASGWSRSRRRDKPVPGAPSRTAPLFFRGRGVNDGRRAAALVGKLWSTKESDVFLAKTRLLLLQYTPSSVMCRRVFNCSLHVEASDDTEGIKKTKKKDNEGSFSFGRRFASSASIRVAGSAARVLM